MKYRFKNSGFTLIELMVVMAIIITLASLSVPIYHKMRSGGYNVACQGNLRAIGSAFLTYKTSYDGWMPKILEERGRQERGVPYEEADSAVSWKYELSFEIANYGPDKRRNRSWELHDAFFDPIKGKGKGNYFASKRQFGARIQTYGAIIDDAGKLVGEGWRDYYDYQNVGSQRVGAGVQGRVMKKIVPKGYMPFTSWKEPSQAAILAPSVDPEIQRAYGKKGEKVNVEYRHSGKANVLFLDGHVQQYVKGDESLFDRFDTKLMEKSDTIQQLDEP